MPDRRRLRWRSVGTSPDEQIEAVLREVETRGGTSAEQQQQLERIGAEVEARLLARRQLGEAERAAREEELEHAIYSR